MDHFTSRKASRRDPKPGLGLGLGLGLDPDHDLAFWLPFRPPGHVVFFLFPPGFCGYAQLFQIYRAS
jgi:hypothetical protein